MTRREPEDQLSKTNPGTKTNYKPQEVLFHNQAIDKQCEEGGGGSKRKYG